MKQRVLNGVVLTVGIAALAFAGCDKDKKDKKGGDTPAAKGGGEAAGPGAARAKGGGSAKSAFNLLPSSSNMVLGINVGALRGTALWKQYAPMIKQQAGEEFKEFTATCGIDPFTAVDSVVIGGDTANEKNMVVAIKGNVPKAKVLECAKKMAEKEGEKIEIKEDGDLVGFSEDGGDTMWVAWLADGTIVTGGGAENNPDWLKGVISGKDSITSNKEFMGLVNSTDSNASVWFAMQPPADDNPFQGMPTGEPPTALFASVDLKSGLKLDAGMRFKSADGAKALAEQANAAMGGMKSDPNVGKYIEKTKVSTSGNDLIVKIDLNQAEFDELMQQLQQQLPMLMMMMGGM